jgi:glycosyltransferase involved in cell wall biosynthesis
MKNKLNQLKNQILIFSTADWGDPYLTNKQHNAIALSHMGFSVLYVESLGLRLPNPSSARDLLRILNRLYKFTCTMALGSFNINSKIDVISPLSFPFFKNNLFIKNLNDIFLAFLINRFYKKRSIKTVSVITYHPYVLNCIKRISHNLLIYHCVDKLSAMPSILNTFEAEEKRLVRQSNYVFTTNLSLNKPLRKINKNTFFFPNVVDLDHFLRSHKVKKIPYDIKEISIPIVIFHGVLSDFKIDFDMVYKICLNMAYVSFVFIGEEREGQRNEVIKRLYKLKNVHMLGHKNYSQLPNYLAFASVGIIPAVKNTYTTNMFPMKFYEYLASGLPVVTTELPYVKGYKSKYVYIAKNTNDFVRGINFLLSIKKMSKIDSINAVGDNTWISRIKFFINKINQSP